eukprot:1602781-Rhodomonas_salina.2
MDTTADLVLGLRTRVPGYAVSAALGQITRLVPGSVQVSQLGTGAYLSYRGTRVPSQETRRSEWSTMGQVQSCFGLQDDCLPRIKVRSLGIRCGLPRFVATNCRLTLGLVQRRVVKTK